MSADERAKLIAAGAMEFSISNGQLVLTFAPERLTVCRECPHLHVVFLDTVSAQRVRQLAAGIADLAEHLE